MAVRWTRDTVAALIDHTLLKPEATEAAVGLIAQEAVDLGVFAVCVSPSMVPAARAAQSAGVALAAVVGFPSGKHFSAIKAQEAVFAVAAGADEIDMVIDVGAAIAGQFDSVAADVESVRSALPDDVILKVIVESAALLEFADEQTLVAACRAAAESGANFVKTSTGFHPSGGASVHAVQIMATTVGPQIGVKASGGIRTAADAIAMLDAGATRLGLSSTRAVLDGLDEGDS
jgi:deoxyribose-phosphate aldolase